MILSTWFDRPLSVAGRMIVRKNGKILEKLVNIDRDLVMIPSLAIHMNRDINGGYHYNVQKDMLPLYSGSGKRKFHADDGRRGGGSARRIFWDMICFFITGCRNDLGFPE